MTAASLEPADGAEARWVSEAERPAIAALFARVFDAFAAEQGRWRQDRLAAIEREGRALAAATVDERGREWYVRLLAVHPDWRRQGLGTRLLRWLADEARRAGALALSLKTFQRWRGMRALLMREGWSFSAAEADERNDGVAERWLLPLLPRPLAVGIIGANPRGRGGEWVQACLDCRWLAVAGIADPRPEVVNAWRERGVAAWERAEDLLREAAPEAAIIAVPPRAMREVQQLCLERGVAMLHEKPLAASLADLAWLQEQLLATRVPLVAGVQRRSHPSFVYLQRLLAPLRHEARELAVTLQLGRPADETPAGFRADARQARGGALLDVGYHALDLAVWLLQAPLDIVASTLSAGGDLAGRAQLEDRAEVLARAGRCWVRLRIARSGGCKLERILVRLPDGCWAARRDGVYRPDGSPAYTCDPAWRLAERGRLAELAIATAARPSAAACDLWDHLALLHLIEQAYARAAQFGVEPAA